MTQPICHEPTTSADTILNLYSIAEALRFLAGSVEGEQGGLACILASLGHDLHGHTVSLEQKEAAIGGSATPTRQTN